MSDNGDLRDLWNSLATERIRVLDEHGVNVANAEMRQFDDGWLYVDDVDGFRVLNADDAARLPTRASYASGTLQEIINKEEIPF